MEQGRLAEAAEEFQAALRLNRFCAPAHYNLGVAALRAGDPAGAIRHLEQSLRLNPRRAATYHNLGMAFLHQGDLPAAATCFREALRLDPNLAVAGAYLGAVLLQQGKGGEATPFLEKAVRQNPTSAEWHGYLGLALAAQGRPHDAVPQYETALRLDPANVAAMDHLARLLAMCPDDAVRNGARAVELAEQACRMTGDRNADLLDTLAAAYAEAGRFDKAVEAARRAIALADQAGQAALANDIRARLEGYQARRPYRSPSGR
jgi:tetratricopeptide (TPR) repeat protein